MISKLLEYRIFACGTFRTNKKFYPKNLMKKDSKYASGDIEYAQCNDISVVRWKDRGSKPVTLISNMHNAADHCVVLRRNSKGQKVPVSCPTGISDYNKYMGGVDKFDQYMAAYTISQKSRRWWIKLFYYFIDTAIVNSYILYKESCNKAKKKYVSQLDYRSMLTDSLVNNFSCRKKTTISPQEKGIGKKFKPSVVEHVPKYIQSYRRCKLCSMRKKEKRSNMMCSTCDVVLCKDFYGPYHKTD